MKNTSHRITSIKMSVIAIILLLGVIGFLSLPSSFKKVNANASGPPGSFTNAPGEGNCSACHGDFPVNSGSGNVTIEGVPANYEPNQAIEITVTVNQKDAVIYGFQLTAIDDAESMVGTFTLPSESPAQTQIVEGFVDAGVRSYVEHTLSGTSPTTFGTKSWTFTWTAPSTDAGNVTFYAAGNGANSDGGTTGDRIYTTSVTSSSAPSGATPFDFDGDSKTDVSIFRPAPGQWWYLRSSDLTNAAFAFGTSSDKLVPADFTGDGVTDVAFWRESTGEWFILRSEDSSFFGFPFGTSGDIPAPGDFDGDGVADAAVFRPSTATWFIQRSSDGGTTITPFGSAEDRPTIADYDGDGKDDIAIFRPSVSQWWQLRSTAGTIAYQFGASGDKTIQGDYTGDGKADVGIFRPSTGQWLILRSEDTTFFGFPFGTSTDIPSPGDYDGDGTFDAAVFRPSTNTWFYNGSTSGNVQLNFGIANDIPIPNVYSVE